MRALLFTFLILVMILAATVGVTGSREHFEVEPIASIEFEKVVCIGIADAADQSMLTPAPCWSMVLDGDIHHITLPETDGLGPVYLFESASEAKTTAYFPFLNKTSGKPMTNMLEKAAASWWLWRLMVALNVPQCSLENVEMRKVPYTKLITVYKTPTPIPKEDLALHILLPGVPLQPSLKRWSCLSTPSGLIVPVKNLECAANGDQCITYTVDNVEQCTQTFENQLPQVTSTLSCDSKNTAFFCTTAKRAFYSPNYLLSPNRIYIAEMQDNGVLTVSNIKTREVVWELLTGIPNAGLVLQADGSMEFVVNGATVSTADPATNTATPWSLVLKNEGVVEIQDAKGGVVSWDLYPGKFTVKKIATGGSGSGTATAAAPINLNQVLELHRRAAQQNIDAGLVRYIKPEPKKPRLPGSCPM